jgi:hypothetical protein
MYVGLIINLLFIFGLQILTPSLEQNDNANTKEGGQKNEISGKKHLSLFLAFKFHFLVI